MERPGLGWHSICISQGSKIPGCLLSQMLRGDTGQAGPEHLGGCCKGPEPSPVPTLPMRKQVHVLGSPVPPEGTSKVMEGVFEIGMVPANPGLLSVWQIRGAN